jgi:predicted nucleic acid-binding protein
MVIVDTTIWSLALRRRLETLNPVEQRCVDRWRELATSGDVVLLGIVRQKLLTGLRHAAQFSRLQRDLDAFDTLVATVIDHDRAAESFNACRARGIAAGDIDMLICALAIRHRLPIFTADADLKRYAKVLPIRLYNLTR